METQYNNPFDPKLSLVRDPEGRIASVLGFKRNKIGPCQARSLGVLVASRVGKISTLVLGYAPSIELTVPHLLWVALGRLMACEPDLKFRFLAEETPKQYKISPVSPLVLLQTGAQNDRTRWVESEFYRLTSEDYADPIIDPYGDEVLDVQKVHKYIHATGTWLHLRARHLRDKELRAQHEQGLFSGGYRSDCLRGSRKALLPSGKVLYEHQLEALKFLVWKSRPNYSAKGALLCDEQGLGKTSVAMAYAFLHMGLLDLDGQKPRGPSEPFRVCVTGPPNIMSGWVREFKKELLASGLDPSEYRVVENDKDYDPVPGVRFAVHFYSYQILSYWQSGGETTSSGHLSHEDPETLEKRVRLMAFYENKVFPESPKITGKRKRWDLTFVPLCRTVPVPSEEQALDLAKELTHPYPVNKVEDCWLGPFETYRAPKLKHGRRVFRYAASYIRAKSIPFDLILADEVSVLKNADSGSTRMLLSMPRNKILALTATPVVSGMNTDLFVPFSLIRVPEFEGSEPPRDFYSEATQSRDDFEAYPLVGWNMNTIGTPQALSDFLEGPEALETLMTSHVWRTAKKDMLWQGEASGHRPEKLPEMNFREVLLKLSPPERKLYDLVRSEHARTLCNSRTGEARRMNMACRFRTLQLLFCNDPLSVPQSTRESFLLSARARESKGSGAEPGPMVLERVKRSLEAMSRGDPCNESECCICQEAMTLTYQDSPFLQPKSSDVLFLPCSHCFCQACMSAWFGQGRSQVVCPLCRAPQSGLENLILFSKKAVHNKGPVQEGPSGLSELDQLFDSGLPGTKIGYLLKEMDRVRLSHPGDKVLIISHHKGFLDSFERFANRLGPGIRVHAAQRNNRQRNTREKIVQGFKEAAHEQDRVHVLLLTFKTGALGTDLPEANHVYVTSAESSSYLEDQARDRISRLGQKKTMYATRLLVADSLEEQLCRAGEEARSRSSSILARSSGSDRGILALLSQCLDNNNP